MNTAKQLTDVFSDEGRLIEKYQLLFKAMFSGFALHEIILDKQGVPCDYRFLEVNPAFEKLTGLNTDQIVGKTVLEILPQTEAYWIEVYGRVALYGQTIRFEQYSKNFDRYYEVQAYCPEKGKFACIFNDVTERKLALAKVEQSERHFKTLVENLGDVIVCYDKAGKRIYVSPKFEQLTGINGNTLLGKGFPETDMPNEIKAQLHESLSSVFKTGKETSCFFTYPHPFKGTRAIEMRFFPEIFQGEVVEVISCARDVTDDVKSVEEKNRLSGQLSDSEKLVFLGSFASNLAQEISHPIYVLSGLVETLRDQLTGKQFLSGEIVENLKQQEMIFEQILGLVQGLNQFSSQANVSIKEQKSENELPHPKKKETVLLLDDEEDIRFILGAYLNDLGLVVEEAASAREALEKMKLRFYDYVLTDFKMPQMSGDEFVSEAKKIFPNLQTKFFLISGDIEIDEEKLTLYQGFISKPFNVKSIAKAFSKK